MPSLKNIKRNCGNCSKEFLTSAKEIRKGWGKFCSRSCSVSYNNSLNNGTNNPNYKGGISKNHYHYKLIEKERYPERIRARDYVRRAIKRGRLKRKACVSCGTNKDIHAHHKDYSKPLEVVWLCAKCHRITHQISC